MSFDSNGNIMSSRMGVYNFLITRPELSFSPKPLRLQMNENIIDDVTASKFPADAGRFFPYLFIIIETGCFLLGQTNITTSSYFLLNIGNNSPSYNNFVSNYRINPKNSVLTSTGYDNNNRIDRIPINVSSYSPISIQPNTGLYHSLRAFNIGGTPPSLPVGVASYELIIQGYHGLYNSANIGYEDSANIKTYGP